MGFLQKSREHDSALVIELVKREGERLLVMTVEATRSGLIVRLTTNRGEAVAFLKEELRSSLKEGDVLDEATTRGFVNNEDRCIITEATAKGDKRAPKRRR